MLQIVNSTRLTSILQSEFNVTSRSAPGNCVAVLFYSPSCIFSCHAAPHYNALHRHFRDIKMVAVDATTHRSFNAQYGIFGIPMLILFHNGKPVARLNETNYNLKMFALFIKSWTNLKPTGKLVVQSSDFSGPISSVPVNDRDYYLLLSWIVIAMQLLYTFYRSSWGRWLADATLSAWREAEDQHHHID
ncbi:UNVERIFIED_CONTAM: hypothetical protein PYX00_002724 [Menopon gallinae]|uniref:Thioredoxin domain-containing protein n=1 Tax=Menopon gallinae TaxID=328185 RepID=A0AAW2HXV3_9NEOP